MALLSEIQAALRVGMSPRLLRWFSSYAPKIDGKRKLAFESKNGEHYYVEGDLLAFDAFLKEPWPNGPGDRPPIPAGILDEIRAEAHFQCAVCGHGNDGEAAHILAVHTSHSNHPHNLLWTCPNHHTAYDHGHRMHATLKEEGVKAVKRRIRESQERLWRIEAQAGSAIVALIQDIEAIRAALAASGVDQFRPGLLAAARWAGTKFQSEASNGNRTEEGALARRVRAAIPSAGIEDESAIEAVVRARDEFLQEKDEVVCPACNGEGAFGLYDVCPACGGDAYMSREDASLVDERDYEQIECAVCRGRGLRGGDDCPACGGEGTLERRYASTLDIRDYEDAPCPLCRETGRFRDRDACPVCGGEGRLEQRLLAQVDLSRFQLVTCKLCRGRGHWGEWDICPACGGDGELEQERAAEVDWAQWK